MLYLSGADLTPICKVPAMAISLMAAELRGARPKLSIMPESGGAGNLITFSQDHSVPLAKQKFGVRILWTFLTSVTANKDPVSMLK